MAYTDNSYPPIGDTLSYERGDGAKINLQVIQPIKLNSSVQTPMVVQPASVTPLTGKDVKKVKTSASIVVPSGVPIVINPSARVNMRNAATKGQRPTGNLPQFNDDAVMDHATIGGKYTAFILFYGDYHELHKKCLLSLLASTSRDRIDLRVGTNAVCRATLDLIEQYVSQGVITKHYCHPENAYKYPVMREMFYDESCPITTKWILWFDDDSICDVEPQWLNILSVHIAQHHKGKDCHMVGASYTWSANSKQRKILESRPWYKNRPWRLKDGHPSPSGNAIIFATGGWWALTTEAMRAADIPDLGTGLTHNGGDWQIGEQLYQAGYGLKQFNGKKQFIRTSSVDRRGVTVPTIDQLPRDAPPLPPMPAQPPSRPPVVQSPVAQPPVETPATVTIPPQPRLRRIVDL